jgi:hypothetical protein
VLEAQEHTAAVARRAEDEARRREWAAKPPKERVRGRVLSWIQEQRLKAGRDPTPAEVAAERARLVAEMVTVERAGAAGGVS